MATIGQLCGKFRHNYMVPNIQAMVLSNHEDLANLSAICYSYCHSDHTSYVHQNHTDL